VRFLDLIERKGLGWNLSLQVLDGILSHNGELHNPSLSPDRNKDFARFEDEIETLTNNAEYPIWPMTMEGCVVRMADTISYIGRDIEDAIRLGLIKRGDIPKQCTRVLGDTNGTIVYTLVEDLIFESLENPHVSFSAEVAEALRELKQFNHEFIYANPRAKHQTHKIELMFRLLFEKYLKDLESSNESSAIFMEFLDGMSPEYRERNRPPMIVRDFIAGMTDDYFLRQCRESLIPQTILDRY
jgi:dGTPase